MKIHKFFVFVLVINWHTNSRVVSMAPVKINLNANLRGVMFTDYLCTITQNLFIFHAVQRTFEHNDGLCVCMPLSFIARYGIGNSFNLGNFLHPKKKTHLPNTTVILFTNGYRKMKSHKIKCKSLVYFSKGIKSWTDP